MTIRFSCSAGHKLSVPDDLAGRKVRCPTCNAKVNVPAQSTGDGDVQQPPIAAPPVAAPPVAAAAQEPPVAAPTEKPARPKPPQRVAIPPENVAPPENKAKPSPPAQKSVSKTPAPKQGSAPPQPRAKPGRSEKPAPPTKQPAAAQKHDKKKPDNKEQGKERKPSKAKPEKSQPAAKSAPTPGAPAPNVPAPNVPAAQPAAPSAPATLSLPFPEAGTELPVATGGRPKTSGLSVRTESNEYKASAGRVQTTYLLAVGVGGVSVLAALPAFPHINLLEAPIWAIAVLVGFLLHALLVVWLVSLPDWSTVWIGGCVLSLTSLLYVVGAGIAAMNAGWMGLAEMRGTAVSWSIVMSVLFALMAFACFRFGSGWRREFEALTPGGV